MPKGKNKKKESKKPVSLGQTQEIRDKQGRYKTGFSGNPEGPKPGYNQFRTIFKKAAEKVAKDLKLGKEPDTIEIEIVKRGLLMILKGKYPSYSFYKDFADRLFGKSPESLDLTSGGEKIEGNLINIDLSKIDYEGLLKYLKKTDYTKRGMRDKSRPKGNRP